MIRHHYYLQNAKVIDNPRINPTFHQVLHMSQEELGTWIDTARDYVLKIWDEEGIPPASAVSEEEISEQFWQIRTYDVLDLQHTDEIDQQSNVLLSPNVGSCLKQFFPGMLKTKIDGCSVYDLFADDRYRLRCQRSFRRHFRFDSFYKYSESLFQGHDLVPSWCDRGVKWLTYFNAHPETFEGYGFWLSEKVAPRQKGTGYTEVDPTKFLWLSKSEIEVAYRIGELSVTHLTNQKKALSCDKHYYLRLYKKNTRIFPKGFTAFYTGYTQVAVNFPPLVAKYIYEMYTGDLSDQDNIIVYDCSSGWGGRIIGAMASDVRSPKQKRHLRYVGTDPNTANWIPELGISRYDHVAQMFLEITGESQTHSYELFQDGSEEIHRNRKFRKYRGKVDFVFSSPPYFGKEVYSDDATQSIRKFPLYDEWRDGFLRRTLETCVDWLRPDRYLAWNIADVREGGEDYPLEEDSNDILEELGMEYVGLHKMCLANMPGSNRIGADAKPTSKNHCLINGKWRKMEPIYIFYKPPRA